MGWPTTACIAFLTGQWQLDTCDLGMAHGALSCQSNMPAICAVQLVKLSSSKLELVILLSFPGLFPLMATPQYDGLKRVVWSPWRMTFSKSIGSQSQQNVGNQRRSNTAAVHCP